MLRNKKIYVMESNHDIEMLEDLVMAAVNEAIRKMDEMSTQKMSKITGGLGGLF